MSKTLIDPSRASEREIEQCVALCAALRQLRDTGDSGTGLPAALLMGAGAGFLKMCLAPQDLRANLPAIVKGLEDWIMAVADHLAKVEMPEPDLMPDQEARTVYDNLMQRLKGKA